MNPTPTPPRPPVRRKPRPLERLEAEIVELSSQLTSATARLLKLVGEFDAAEGWRDWGMRSTAHWLSWKCGLSLTAGREQVRVARALRTLPKTMAAFRAGRLSYSKVRAITRIATPETETDLVMTATHATAAQLDKILASHRRAVRSEDVRQRRRAEHISWHYDDDGSLVGTFRISPERAAAVVQAIDTGTGSITTALGEGDPTSGQEPGTPGRRSRVDVFVDLCEQRLATAAAGASPERAEIYQVTIHTRLEDLARPDNADDDGAPITIAGLGTTGLRIHPDTTRRVSCDCPATVVIEDADGTPLHLNRRQRRIRGRLRRAVHTRDRGLCRTPGCTAPATQIHHIRHWAHHGVTCLANLISLCDAHHWAVHEGGFSIVTLSPGRWAMLSPAGVTVDPEPPSVAASQSLTYDEAVAADAITGDWDGTVLTNASIDMVLSPTFDAAARRPANTPAEASSTPENAPAEAFSGFTDDQIERFGAWVDELNRPKPGAFIVYCDDEE